MKMPSLPSLCFPTVFIQSFLLLSMASLSKGFTVVSGYLPSSQWKCSTHPVTARLSICRFSIRPEQNPVILLRLSLTPRPQEFEARHSHSIIESYSEYHRQGQTFRILLNAAISSSLYHEDSDLTEWLARLSGEHSVVRRSTMHRAIRNPRDIHPIEGRTEVVVSHTFIGENDDECHGSSHSSS